MYRLKSDRTVKGQAEMNKVALVAALAFAAAAPAFAADMPVKAKKVAVVETPSPWDIAFGGGLEPRLVRCRMRQPRRG